MTVEIKIEGREKENRKTKKSRRNQHKKVQKMFVIKENPAQKGTKKCLLYVLSWYVK